MAKGPLRKVIGAEIDCSLREGKGFAATLWLECGHGIYTERSTDIDCYSMPFDYRPPGYWHSVTLDKWVGGRKRCQECLVERDIGKLKKSGK